jgi:A/G-specific adenine glycosylase
MSFNSLILIWFDKNKRNLPWRGQIDPYKIWLSEIILQQTRVAQGTAYYNRFAETYPTVKSLAEAEEQDVLKLWQGLGYYSRARNLHFTAKYVNSELNGRFPTNFFDLQKLKGVGEYTAAAIASISFHEPVPSIDGNVFRVFARYFNIDLDISQPKTKKYFFELGKEIMDKDRPGDFNQAVMELGATICTPTNPNCEDCPVNESCEALAKNKVHLLPVKTKKTKVSNRYLHFIEITDGENFLIKKRIEKDVWMNLYNFPIIELSKPEISKESFGIYFEKEKPKLISEEVHILSHQRLHIEFWRLEVSLEDLNRFGKKLNAEIVSYGKLKELPFPRPMEKYLGKEYGI